jgi:hypothetical protein
MRTKSLCLAAALLTGGVLAASAQGNVYSLNIVGYVNKIAPVPNQFALWSNPLDTGAGNSITNLFPTAGNGTQIRTWNGAAYTSAQKSFGNWNTNLVLTPGIGFFIRYPLAAGVVTNTFTGNVLIEQPAGAGGGTNNSAITSTFQLLGSKMPIAGNLTTTGVGTFNLGAALANGSQVRAWNGVSFVSAQKSFGNWNTNLPIDVADGFFVRVSAGTSNWVQILTNAP